MDDVSGYSGDNQQSSVVSINVPDESIVATLRLDTKREDFFKRIIYHPLQKEPQSPFLGSSSGSSITFASHTSSSVDTVSLIQAAAKSVLEDSKDASISDDEDGRDLFSDSGRSHSSNEDANRWRSPGLQSLQKEKLPALPDEQDRKRFLGCLASVLASCYAYDMETDETVSSLQCQKVNKLPQHEQNRVSDERYFCKSDGDGSFDEKKFDLETSCLRSSAEILQDSLRGAQSSQQIFLLESRPDLRHTNRHRKRRFDVLSRLLVQSAELMLLDKNQGKCFLPMLDKLMKPASNFIQKNQSRASCREGEEPVHEYAEQQSCHDASIEKSYDFNDQGFAFLETKMNEIEHLRPFLESMSPGAGIRCLTMFLIRHLLHSDEGYDARIRHALKTLGVLLIMHDIKQDPDSFLSLADQLTQDFGSGTLSSSFLTSDTSKLARLIVRSPLDIRSKATRLFENLETAVAGRLISLSTEQSVSADQCSSRTTNYTARSEARNTFTRQPKGFTSESVLRGLKIGGVAVAAGALFAFTGGLAAPGIAAGVAAIAGGTAITASAAALLTSTVAVTAIFGVGGGGLAAYKMQRRTIGLTEFEFSKERKDRCDTARSNKSISTETPEAELFSTVCIAGWLRDNCDFQRPWGVTPTLPRITDRLELLERFYYVCSLDHVAKCKKILNSWKGEEKQLWRVLRQKYGHDPNHLLPLQSGARSSNALTHEQLETVDQLFIELGYAPADQRHKRIPTPFERMFAAKTKIANGQETVSGHRPVLNGRSLNALERRSFSYDSLHGPTESGISLNNPYGKDCDTMTGQVEQNLILQEDAHNNAGSEAGKLPRHLATVWNYQATYGGELYTVRWETDLLTEICDSVADLAFDVVSGGTGHLLKLTALSTLISAMAWPYALVHAANMIDPTWTLGVERADAAGKELARSLLFSTAGNRPVTLVGFSFGARAIYSCLKELSRFQEKWEDFRENSIDVATEQCRGDVEIQEGTNAFFMKMREPASIVEDVVLMGLPNHLSAPSWKACRRIVAGRLVHCFSQRDLILSLMFQYKKFGLKPVCGTCPVNVAGVENVDVTDLISGHQDYCFNVGAILKRVRHCEPFSSSAPSYIDSGFNANEIAREVARLDKP